MCGKLWVYFHHWALSRMELERSSIPMLASVETSTLFQVQMIRSCRSLLGNSSLSMQGSSGTGLSLLSPSTSAKSTVMPRTLCVAPSHPHLCILQLWGPSQKDTFCGCHWPFWTVPLSPTAGLRVLLFPGSYPGKRIPKPVVLSQAYPITHGIF